MTNLATEQTSDRAHFLEDIAQIAAIDGPETSAAVRETGAKQLETLEFPNRRQEEWRFTNIAPIVRTPFRVIPAQPARELTDADVAPFLYDQPDWSQLVFVDGFFAPKLSRIAAEGKDLAGSIASANSSTAAGQLNKSLKASNIYAALNSACLQDGATISIPPNTILENPIHILFVSTAEGEWVTHPRTVVHVGKSSEASIIESFAAAPGASGYLTNAVAEIVLEDNAKLHRHKIVEEADDAHHLSVTQVRQGRDTQIESHVMSLSGRIIRNELNVLLDGENAECGLNGLYLNDNERLIDNAIFVEHGKPNCRSRMAYKGILNDKSSAVFTGKVLVPQDSQKTDSNQLNQNLLLSDEATIDTKPQLEIFADDVKCTHGATIGAFPSQLVFYFRSRGMSEAMARGILTYGFAGEIVREIEIEPLRDRLDTKIFEKYSPSHGAR